MTVRQLIAALRKMPANAKVVVCDHDQDDESGEYNGSPGCVTEASATMRERGYGVVIRL